jgi:hypothetical protein
MRGVTAAELEKMTPAEREATFKGSIIRDLDQVPADRRDVIEAQRTRVLERAAQLRKNASCPEGSSAQQAPRLSSSSSSTTF